MKKALMLSSVASMIDQFNMQNISILMDMGYEVHVACNFQEGNTSSLERVKKFRKELMRLGAKVHDIPIPRSIYKIHRIVIAYIMVKQLAGNHKYAIVHCHSPIGGVIARLAFRKERERGTKVIYTAHGFHFYKGAPLKNWLLFYPIEKICAKYTDCLITINKEDYKRAKKKFKGNELKVSYLPGIGIDVGEIKNTKVNKEQLKKELKIPEESMVILTVAELSKRKNYESSLKAFAKIDKMNIVYLICGSGKELDRLKKLTQKLQIDNQVYFLGFRNDIHKILKIADLFFFTSKQEGLPVAIMEAMAAGVPIVCSDVRGNSELVNNSMGGYVRHIYDIEGYKNAIIETMKDCKLRSKFGEYNIEHISDYDVSHINSRMQHIYQSIQG